jgi:hypothetical protein
VLQRRNAYLGFTTCLAVLSLAIPGWADDPAHAIVFNGFQDGSGSYVRVPDSDAFDMNQPMTLEAWVKWNGEPGYRVFLAKATADVPGFVSTGYHLVIWDGLACLGLQKPGVGRLTCSGAPIEAGVWTHVAVSYDGRLLIVYLNGTESNRADWGFTSFAASDSSAGQSTPLLIGREFLSDLVDRTFGGTLDEVRIWNTDLSAATIQKWYSRIAPDSHPSIGNLVAYHQFNEGLSQNLNTHDQSGNGHDGVLANGASRVRSDAPLAN